MEYDIFGEHTEFSSVEKHSELDNAPVGTEILGGDNPRNYGYDRTVVSDNRQRLFVNENLADSKEGNG